MSTTILTPNSSEFYQVVIKTIKEIQPGLRVQILIPNAVSHEGGYHNWDSLENIQMDIRGYGGNVFSMLRFDQKSDEGDVIVDICHFA